MDAHETLINCDHCGKPIHGDYMDEYGKVCIPCSENFKEEIQLQRVEDLNEEYKKVTYMLLQIKGLVVEAEKNQECCCDDDGTCTLHNILDVFNKRN